MKFWISLSIFLAVASFASVTFADENPSEGGAPWAEGSSPRVNAYGRRHFERRGERREFIFGVCVGQNLAQQGVTLPAPQPGQKPALDDATKAAFKSAEQTCRQQFEAARGASPSPEPSASPTVAPSATPSAVPTTSTGE